MNVEQIYQTATRRPVMGRKGTLLTGVFLAPLMAAAVSTSAHAGDVKVTPSIAFGETFTDNVLLTSTNRQSDWVQSISPRLQLTDTGNRVNFDITGGGDYLYFDRLNKDDLRPFLQGSATVEAVPDLLRINGQASVQETLLNPSGAFTVSPYNDSQNRQTLQVYSVGPSLFHHFSSFADAELDYRFSYIKTDAVQIAGVTPLNLLSSSYVHNVDLAVTSGAAFNRFTWDLSASYNRSQNNLGNLAPTGTTATNQGQFASLLTGNYRVNSFFALIADVGYDHLGNNSAAAVATLRGGVVYHGGFELKGPKSSLRFLVGQRYGDLSIEGSAAYNYSARTTMTASYTEEVTTSAQRLAALLGLAAQNNFSTAFNLDPRFTLTDEQFLSRRGSLSIAITRGKNSLNLTGFADRQSYRIVPRRDWVYGGTLAYSRQMNRKWTFDSTLLYTYQDFNNFTIRKDDLYAAQIGVTDQFARSINVSLTYRLSYRNSTDPTFDVQENAVTLLLTTVF